MNLHRSVHLKLMNKVNRWKFLVSLVAKNVKLFIKFIRFYILVRWTPHNCYLSRSSISQLIPHSCLTPRLSLAPSCLVDSSFLIPVPCSHFPLTLRLKFSHFNRSNAQVINFSLASRDRLYTIFFFLKVSSSIRSFFQDSFIFPYTFHFERLFIQGILDKIRNIIRK